MAIFQIRDYLSACGFFMGETFQCDISIAQHSHLRVHSLPVVLTRPILHKAIALAESIFFSDSFISRLSWQLLQQHTCFWASVQDIRKFVPIYMSIQVGLDNNRLIAKTQLFNFTAFRACCCQTFLAHNFFLFNVFLQFQFSPFYLQCCSFCYQSVVSVFTFQLSV